MWIKKQSAGEREASEWLRIQEEKLERILSSSGSEDRAYFALAAFKEARKIEEAEAYSKKCVDTRKYLFDIRAHEAIAAFFFVLPTIGLLWATLGVSVAPAGLFVGSFAARFALPTIMGRISESEAKRQSKPFADASKALYQNIDTAMSDIEVTCADTLADKLQSGGYSSLSPELTARLNSVFLRVSMQKKCVGDMHRGINKAIILGEKRMELKKPKGGSHG